MERRTVSGSSGAATMTTMKLPPTEEDTIATIKAVKEDQGEPVPQGTFLWRLGSGMMNSVTGAVSAGTGAARSVVGAGASASASVLGAGINSVKWVANTGLGVGAAVVSKVPYVGGSGSSESDGKDKKE